MVMIIKKSKEKKLRETDLKNVCGGAFGALKHQKNKDVHKWENKNIEEVFSSFFKGI